MASVLSSHAAKCRECGGTIQSDGRDEACVRCGLVHEPDHAPGAFGATQLGGVAPPRRIAPHLHDRTGRRRPRSLARAEPLFGVLAETLRLPEYVREDAKRLHRRALRGRVTQGRRVEAVVAACLLEATRDRGVPRTLGEVALAARVSASELGRTLRAITESTGQRVLPPSPERLLPAIASRAGVPAAAVAPAAALLREHAARLAGRRSEPLAAAALVHACRRLGARCNVSALARASSVSRQAIYDALAELSSAMNPFGPNLG